MKTRKVRIKADIPAGLSSDRIVVTDKNYGDLYFDRIIEPSDTVSLDTAGAVPDADALNTVWHLLNNTRAFIQKSGFSGGDFSLSHETRRVAIDVENGVYMESMKFVKSLATPQPALAQVEKEPIKPVEWNDLYDLAQAAGTDSDVCDHDFSGKPITHYDVMITGAYSPFLLRLINLALQKFGNPPPAQAENSEPYIPEIIRRLADWERENGTLAAPTPPEYEAICQLLASASRYESPRQAFDKLNNTAAVDPANTVAPVDGKGNEK